MAEVIFDRATRIYPGTAAPAVAALELKINDGELMVLVGPSGSGKSTALRMLAGLELVDDGRIFIGDREVTDMAPKDRDIAMVFQNYALYPHMTVAQNIGFNLKVRRRPKKEITERVVEAARLLEDVAQLHWIRRRLRPVPRPLCWPAAASGVFRACSSTSKA